MSTKPMCENCNIRLAGTYVSGAFLCGDCLAEIERPAPAYPAPKPDNSKARRHARRAAEAKERRRDRS